MTLIAVSRWRGLPDRLVGASRTRLLVAGPGALARCRGVSVVRCRIVRSCGRKSSRLFSRVEEAAEAVLGGCRSRAAVDVRHVWEGGADAVVFDQGLFVGG